MKAKPLSANVSNAIQNVSNASNVNKAIAPNVSNASNVRYAIQNVSNVNNVSSPITRLAAAANFLSLLVLPLLSSKCVFAPAIS